MTDREVAAQGRRANRSLELLRNARIWDLKIYDDERQRPSSQRAVERGNEMLGRANRTSSSLQLRRRQAEAAKKYYEFGGFRDRAASASATLAEIEPALEAERADREEEIECAVKKMQLEAKSAWQALEDMQKSTSENQKFKREAEAMDDELGF